MNDPKVASQLKNLKSEMVRRENASQRGRRPIKHAPLPAHRLPSLLPDWTLTPGQPREFEEPFSAIFTLVSKLSKKT